ncbi:Reticulon-like protein B9 [Carex littledalei]|uniref:Reticulon-like protein n=1 Tax=Carex littledalei TaxID=544730 RepID=A0A833QRV7_9POAL|nr:Reticulon-like protein B9 [Carex littledalei]
MPRLKYYSDSDDEPEIRRTTIRTAVTTSSSSIRKPFSQKRSVHAALGGGKVADILLWRNRNLSAGLLAGATIVWFLFDVVEYNLIELLSHISLLAMLFLLVWSWAAQLIDRNPPQIPETILSEQTFREVAWAFHSRLAHFISTLLYIASGKDLRMFLTVIGCLWIVSVIGSSCSFTSLLYLGFLCIHTLPALYERYQAEVNHLVARGREDLRKFYSKFDSVVLNKIPRGPTKIKKFN